MSFSGLAIAATILALVGVVVAVAAGLLLCLGRRRLAERVLPVFLLVLAGGTLLSFAAMAEGPKDLQDQAERTLAFAAAAERTELARSGHYTTSVARLGRLDRSLRTDVKVSEPNVQVLRGPGVGSVTVWVSLGPGTRAQATLRPDGRLESVAVHRRPPRRLESVGAALFLAAHQLAGLHLSYYFTHNSDNLNGHPALALAGVMSVLQLVALVGVWGLFARGPATRERLLTTAAAAVCAFIVFDRVLSPQYLIWLAPLVATVKGPRGLAAVALLACAMSMTQIWYPLHFAPLKSFQPLESWAVIGRDLVLVALLVTLVWPDEKRTFPGRGRRRLRTRLALRS